MFFKKKKKDKVVEAKIVSPHEEAEKEEEKKKFKIKPKTLAILIGILAIVIVVFAITLKINSYREDRGKTFSSALNSFILNNYEDASIKLKDIKPKNKDEEAFIKLIRKSKDIKEETEKYEDEEIINEYIKVLEEMKKIVEESDGITITIYKKDEFKDITITTVPFDDAIRYAKEQIEKLNEDKKNNLIFGGKKEDNLSIFTYKESKMIGYFIEEVNIKGDGDSYYRNK